MINPTLYHPRLQLDLHPKIMQPRNLFRPSTLPRLIRLYSSQSTPLINITDLQAPSRGRIRIISLARPSARNAISRQFLWELRSHIDAIAGEYDSDGNELPPASSITFGGAVMDNKGPTRAVIVHSEVDSCFCAGADLKERAGFTSEECVSALLRFS